MLATSEPEPALAVTMIRAATTRPATAAIIMPRPAPDHAPSYASATIMPVAIGAAFSQLRDTLLAALGGKHVAVVEA